MRVPNNKAICLVILFNHRFDRNLPVVRKLYEGRFSNIRFIVPFYDGDDDDVISVYDSSYTFQGYIAQAEKELYKLEADYYFFVADDMIINPNITEENIIEELGINGEVLISGFQELPKGGWNANRISDACMAFSDRKDVNFKTELKSADDAFKIAKKKGYNSFDMRGRKFKRTGKGYWIKNSSLKSIWNYIKKNQLPYPLFYGYSDWIMLSKGDLHTIAPKLGVTAAMGLFVEIAIPTIVCLYCEKIRFVSDTKYRGGEMWDDREVNEFNTRYNYDLNRLLLEFPQDKLYIHPVKLSKWKYEDLGK